MNNNPTGINQYSGGRRGVGKTTKKPVKISAARSHQGYTIIKTGKSKNDYRVDLDGRTRWGTLKEIKTDISNHRKGMLASPKRGWA